nr:MAG TPA: putative lysin [Caudoviricetes sp.]
MKVPVSNEFSVGVSNAPAAHFSAAQLPDAGAPLAHAANQAFTAGQEMVNAQAKMLAEMNDLAADNALAQVKAFEQDLRVNPDMGYESLRGENALNRPDGQSLVDEYDGYLMKRANEIKDTLKNDVQKSLFSQRLESIRQTLRNKTGEHLLSEGQKWKETSLNSQIDLAANSFTLSTSDEERDAAIKRAIGAAKGLQNLNGWDSETMQKKVMDASDKAIRQVIDDQIDKGNYAEATRLAIKYGAFAHGETVVKARQKIEQAYQDQVIEDATANFKPGDVIQIPVNADSSKADTGNPIQDAVSRIIGYESGNDPNIKNKKSTAEGLGQFIDSTWLYMVKKYRPDIAKGKTDAQLKALKRDPALSREMTTRYVEENAALLKKHGFPVNVRNLYVMHFLGSGEGPKLLRADPNQPVSSFISARSINANQKVLSGKTAQQVLDWAARAMKVGKGGGGGTSYVSIPTGDPVAMEKAIRQLPKNQQASVRANINRQISAYKEVEEQRKAQRDNAIAGIIETNGGNIQSVPRSAWAALTPEERRKFTDFGQSIKKNNEQELQDKYADDYLMMQNPDVLSKMSEDSIIALRPKLGRSWTQSLLEQKQSIEKKGIEHANLSNYRFKEVLRREFNIDPDKKIQGAEMKRRIATIKYNIGRAIKAEEIRLGRQLSEDEMVAIIRKLAAATVVTERGWFSDTTKSILEIHPDDEKVSVRY